jgi:hypothetical protein
MNIIPDTANLNWPLARKSLNQYPKRAVNVVQETGVAR